MKLRSILLCTAAIAIAPACEDNRTEQIDEAVENVADQREDVADQREDLAEADSPGDELEQRADVAHASAELAKAEVDFETRRDRYVDELRFRHDVYEIQTAVANGMLADPALPEDDQIGRASCRERVKSRTSEVTLTRE